MPASIDTPLSGTFRIECRTKGDLNEVQLAGLNRLLDGFVDAIALGMFLPATLQGEPQSLAQAPPRVHGRTFSATQLHPGAFRILNGMFVFYSGYVAPLDQSSARIERASDDLLRTRTPFPPAVAKPPFPVQVTEPKASAPPLAIRVDFATAPLRSDRPELMRAFEIWNCLMSGGFPPEEQPPGESGIGPAMTTFLSPTLLEHAVEGYIADPACFHVIINVVTALARKYPVVGLEIE